jgi:hypothetical protein
MPWWGRRLDTSVTEKVADHVTSGLMSTRAESSGYSPRAEPWSGAVAATVWASLGVVAGRRVRGAIDSAYILVENCRVIGAACAARWHARVWCDLSDRAVSVSASGFRRSIESGGSVCFPRNLGSRRVVGSGVMPPGEAGGGSRPHLVKCGGRIGDRDALRLVRPCYSADRVNVRRFGVAICGDAQRGL